MKCREEARQVQIDYRLQSYLLWHLGNKASEMNVREILTDYHIPVVLFLLVPLENSHMLNVTLQLLDNFKTIVWELGCSEQKPCSEGKMERLGYRSVRFTIGLWFWDTAAWRVVGMCVCFLSRETGVIYLSIWWECDVINKCPPLCLLSSCHLLVKFCCNGHRK